MQIALDRSLRQPLCRQIAAALVRAVEDGTAPAGLRLPGARTLARSLGVNRSTVETAFGLLETAGYLERAHGSGTYLRARSPQPPAPRRPPPPAPLPPVRWNFATGMGDPSLIPAREFRRVFQSVLRREGALALGYEPPQGYPPLRAAIAEILSAQGLPARPEHILITSGSQQAISLTAQVLVPPGGTVFVEGWCYDAALALFRQLGYRVVALPLDEHGVRLDRLAALLRRGRPDLIYTMPSFQNPTARVLPIDRRRRLVELAAQYRVPVLEDDYVGELQYEGRTLPCLKTLDRTGNVLYTSTFSKLLVPGFRLGFLLAEEPVLARLTAWKQRLEISSPSILQRALHAFVSVGRYRRHVRKARRVYGARRAAFLAAARQHWPRSVAFAVPTGGLFCWVRLPPGLTAPALHAQARALGLDFAVGDRFYATGRKPAEAWIRLNFVAQEIPVLEEGVRRLGRLLRAAG